MSLAGHCTIPIIFSTSPGFGRIFPRPFSFTSSGMGETSRCLSVRWADSNHSRGIERQGLLPTALYWEWMVRRGRQHGLRIPGDYIEVRYEELVSDPRATVRKLGEFLDHDLDYDCIQKTSLGRLREPNSSFGQENEQRSPLNRWSAKLSRSEIMSLEAMVGELLKELGYSLSSPGGAPKSGFAEKAMRAFYFSLLNTKLWLKTQTPAGRLANLGALEIFDHIESTEAE